MAATKGFSVTKDTNLCPVYAPWAVVDDDEQQLVACHVSQASAEQSINQMVDTVADLASSEPYEDRVYNAADRKKMAASGAAMPDGSYPIANGTDLQNAIHAVGRGSGSHDAIRRHIIKRAKALGLTSMIPENWNASGAMNADSEPVESRGLEQRAFTLDEVELRAGKDGLLTLAGYASTFNDPYKVHDRYGSFDETILPGSWDDTLRGAGNIHLLVAHGAHPVPLASTRAGTLRLDPDSHGLGYEADIVPQRSSIHAEVAFAVERRDMDEMSVGMRIPADGDRWNDAQTERYISRADLIEISVLSRGANPSTSAGIRNEELLAEIRRLETMLDGVETSRAVDRHLAGLTEALARSAKRRYPPT
jgi:HK97 family phage prohead protease